jgi:CRISPR-associated protein Csm4
MKLIKLIPGENDKYHFGEGDLTDSSIIFHSHSLYSAIINNFIKLYGIEEFNKHKKELEKIKLSSLLPAIYKLEDGKLEDFIYFLPRPATRLGFDKETQKEVDEKPKEIKKVQFISVNALKKHNERKLKKSFKFKKEGKEKNCSLILGKKFLIDEKDYEKMYDFGIKKPENMQLFKSFIEQKVAIDRIKQITLEEEKGQLYSVGYVKPLTYTSNNNKNNRLIVGYYFLLDFEGDNNLLNKIKSAIRLIKDEGLGGERSNGAGLFREIIIENGIPNDLKELFDEKDEINTRMTLSTTIPKDESEFNKIISYQLMKISGYVYSSSNYSSIIKSNSSYLPIARAKKYIYAIKEGAMVKEEIKGKIENIEPDNYNHEVLVNGEPILVPTKYYEG